MEHSADKNKNIMIPPDITGLSNLEIQERVQQGQVNLYDEDITRSTKDIIYKNTFTLFNIIIMVLAIVVMCTGEFKNGIFFWVVILNSSIGIFQEIRAKKTIEELSVLAKTNATVVRDGQIMSIPQEEIVIDDILYLCAGNQVPSDGQVIHSVGLEVDESLLTGESDNILKLDQDTIMSGSFITVGEGYIKVTAVGEDNYSVRLTNEAKAEKRNPSQLMKSLNNMIKVLSIFIVPVGIGLFISQYNLTLSFKQSILAVSAAVVSMIPEGLMLLTSVAFAVGAANLAKKKTLVQSLPCIETLARVDTICLDKTGTITDGSLRFEKFILIGDKTEKDLQQAIVETMNILPDKNATAEAVRKFFPAMKSEWTSKRLVPFSSARKWSGVSFCDCGSYVLGAPEFIFKELPEEIEKAALQHTNDGYRVLAFVHFSDVIEGNTLPENGETIALFILSDSIRENAKDTFSYFEEQDVTLKVISGDNPVSVSNIALQAGIKNAEKYVDMSQHNNSLDYAELVEKNTVFGRVTPYQKRELLIALKENGHTTCMTGDGVNDVLSLREADVGVAMASGSDAAKSSSDVILLTSDFSAMIDVLKEGRRVINNIERVAAMYLVKTIYSIILSFMSIGFGVPYPFTPLQLSPINTLTVGIPSFVLALKPSYERIKGKFITNIVRISFPAALTVVLSIMILNLADQNFSLGTAATSTMSVLVTGCVGFNVLYSVARPLDLIRKIMIVALFAAFIFTLCELGWFFTYISLFDRNAFFYLPLVLGSPTIYKYLSSAIHNIIHYFNKAKNYLKSK